MDLLEYVPVCMYVHITAGLHACGYSYAAFFSYHPALKKQPLFLFGVELLPLPAPPPLPFLGWSPGAEAGSFALGFFPPVLGSLLAAVLATESEPGDCFS